MTLDKVEMHLAKAFSTGMVYVALSRLRALDGLCLRSFSPSKVIADPIVRAWWDEHFANEKQSKQTKQGQSPPTEKISTVPIV